mgnify:FL=1
MLVACFWLITGGYWLVGQFVNWLFVGWFFVQGHSEPAKNFWLVKGVLVSSAHSGLWGVSRLSNS